MIILLEGCFSFLAMCIDFPYYSQLVLMMPNAEKNRLERWIERQRKECDKGKTLNGKSKTTCVTNNH